MKHNTFSYSGIILMLISRIDLSDNKLIGEILRQIGNLTMLISLNLLCNNLTGPIPLEFSKLMAIESLDLSYNNLNGKIPPKLNDLRYLGVFTIAQNNFSGKIPRGHQLDAFQRYSFKGNPPCFAKCNCKKYAMKLNHHQLRS
ncbi:hypothetical protein Pint_14438 [Pistacia integerrima]|uniref:Uncharacterized protein n=1 Tax=Pistacia integerrima TaxID=434235 RepID=A0ACC0YAR7_9ROSI|nr:hypothetical protein Pint_14438 [Pistacia integerrima]